jgi:LysM repeat protein
VRTATLASANGVSTKDKVQVGQQLMIPRATVTPVPATRHAAPTAAQASTPTSTSTSTTYRVKQGDTLYSIARQFDTTVDTLKHLNHITSDVIVVGDKLTVRNKN